MKITTLSITDFLGVSHVDIATPEPVVLFAGHNAAGKSSIRDAVALALTGDLSRVALKKEAGAMVRTGAQAAACELQTADGDVYGFSITAAGKMRETRPKAENLVLPFVLDAQRFAGLDVKARRSFLFELMRVQTDLPAVKASLLKRGADAARVERIAPLLRSGFDAAHKQAKENASEARGAWKSITGEAYGSEKAKTWKAPLPAGSTDNMPTLQTQMKQADVAIEQWQAAVANFGAQLRQREAMQARLPALQEHAGRVDRIRRKMEVDDAALATLQAELAKTQAAAGAGPRVGLVHDLGTSLAWALAFAPEDPPEAADALAALQAYEAEHGKVGATAGDPAAAARLPALKDAIRISTSAVANNKRDLEAAIGAGAEANSLAAELAQPFDEAGHAAAKQQLETLKAERAAVQQQFEAQRVIRVAIDGAVKKTELAAQHHVDVVAWELIADALAPDGIPGEILAKALGPINARLAQSAADTTWQQVVIAEDMAITAGGRAYGLLSESEQWRVDAVVAEAISHLSGAKLLVLDRFDVLDATAGRPQFIAWLEILAEQGELDTALVFGTLKSAPAGSAFMASHWIAAGVLHRYLELEAA